MDIGNTGKQSKTRARISQQRYNIASDDNAGTEINIDELPLTPPLSAESGSSPSTSEASTSIQRSRDTTAPAPGGHSGDESLVIELPASVQNQLYGRSSASSNNAAPRSEINSGPSAAPAPATARSSIIQRAEEPAPQQADQIVQSDEPSEKSSNDEASFTKAVARRVYEMMMKDLKHERERLGKRRF